jgi:hypothetical protein
VKEYAQTEFLQLRYETWAILLPYLKRAVDEYATQPGGDREILTELGNLRNAAYCRTEGRGDAVSRNEVDSGVVGRASDAAALTDDWLSI